MTMDATPAIAFLDPTVKLLDAVTTWLLNRVRTTPEGASSLAHLMIVVPTAQSGRNLRLALAQRAGAILPPKVVQPRALVKGADESLREANEIEIAAAFQQYVRENRDKVLSFDLLVRPEEFDDLTARFALLDQLQDIWRILAGGALLMRDVPARAAEFLANDLGDEASRWRQLAALETDFFGYLHAHGMCYPTESVCAAKLKAAIVGPEIEEIVLPALADPICVLADVLRQQIAVGRRVTTLLHADRSDEAKFDVWGRPRTEAWTGTNRPDLTGLSDEDIVCAAYSSALAQRVSDDFPSVDSGVALPALSLCDGDLFEAVSAAFLNSGYVIHNPERHRLVQSSLGRLIRNLMAIYAADNLPWRDFAGLFRSDDVLSAMGLSGMVRAEALAGLDVVQNAYLPTAVPAEFAFPDDPDMRTHDRTRMSVFCDEARKLESVLSDAKKDAPLTVFLRRMLKWIFASHALSGLLGEREFVEATHAVRDFLDALEGDFITGLPMTAGEFAALARRGLDAAVYSLEPETPDAVKTEGWLELAWSAADQIALAGFHEGCVPDSVIGHPFLPDALREALGLVSNADRLARDTWLMKELVDSHAPHAVRAYVARANDAGDICRPSRLLYLYPDADLIVRIRGLFGDLPAVRTDKVRRVEWLPHLPDAVERPARLSPSSLDTYVKCPFTWLLKYGLGMNPFREKRELEANDFGSLAHAALKDYADRQIARGDDQLTDAREIRRVFHEAIFPSLRARFGATTLNVDLQLRALEGRLDDFAEEQAAWAREGWRIRMAERSVEDFLPDLGCHVRGVIDRVDENIAGADRPWCLVDYKTWDEKKLVGRVFTSNREILSVQLPVYGKLLAAVEPRIPFAAQQLRYLILGLNARETGFCDALTDEVVASSIAAAQRAVRGIGRNIFWPPGSKDEWKWDFRGLFVSDPATDLAGSAWEKVQLERLEAEHD